MSPRRYGRSPGCRTRRPLDVSWPGRRADQPREHDRAHKVGVNEVTGNRFGGRQDQIDDRAVHPDEDESDREQDASGPHRKRSGRFQGRPSPISGAGVNASRELPDLVNVAVSAA